MVDKVFAYITRTAPNGLELLTFRHRDYPDAGIQVPGGTVEDGEAYEVAALREAFEESGLSGFEAIHDLGSYVHTRYEGDAEVKRHFFHMEVSGTVPDQFEHVVSSGTNDKGLVFLYSWSLLGRPLRLMGEQDRFVSRLPFVSSSLDLLGVKVEVCIDRPLGSKHPVYGFVYETNYGYLPGTRSPDGEELDAYYLGADNPLERAEGTCIAVIRRRDDDDKLVVVPSGTDLSDEEIIAATAFQERWFEIKILRRQA